MQSGWIKLIYFLTASVIITCCAVGFRENNTNEREFLRFKIGQEDKTVTIDISQQGFLKYYLQPGTISIYCRGQNSDIVKPLYAKFSGPESFISQGSKKGIWKKLQPGDRLNHRENNEVPINIELAIPYSATRQYHAGKGILEIFTDENTMNKIIFNFINSKYQ